MNENKYDLIILGAGAAGLTAGIYAGRYKLNTLILGSLPGGTMTEAHKICNFPSYEEITGFELTKKMYSQVQNLGINIKPEQVKEVEKDEEGFIIRTSKKEYLGKKIIIAAGSEKNRLNIPGEKKLAGKGVSYCSTCDAAFYKDKIVGVIGGGNAALASSVLISEYAKKVYIIYRKDKFRKANKSWIEQAEKDKKIEFLFNSDPKEIHGEDKVESIELKNGEKIKLDGIFVEIGQKPDKTFSDQLNLETEEGYIKVNKKQETSLKGVFAAGDITNNPLKQIITASAEGSIAASSAYEEIISERE